jgi:hypothetical protein
MGECWSSGSNAGDDAHENNMKAQLTMILYVLRAVSF